MLKAYKVAHHIFHLELKDDSPLWPALSQYSPFEICPDEGEPLFSLQLCQGFEEKEMSVIYDAPTEPGETVIKLYKGEGFLQFEMAPCSDLPVCGVARVGEDLKHAQLHIMAHTLSNAVFAVNNTLMLLYAFSTADKRTLEMHASVIRNDGKGYLFLAKSGTGKSTHSNLWLENIPGSDLLNDDNPIVRAWPDGRVIVYGSPWSGKTPCYRNIECPVGAFVQIKRSRENRIERVSVFEAYAMLYSSCSGLKSDDRMSDGLHESMEGAVVNIPCFNLYCRPDAEAAFVCAKGVKDEQ